MKYSGIYRHAAEQNGIENLEISSFLGRQKGEGRKNPAITERTKRAKSVRKVLEKPACCYRDKWQGAQPFMARPAIYVHERSNSKIPLDTIELMCYD